MPATARSSASGLVGTGTYGQAPTRQRYRCSDPDGAFHRFTPPLARELTEGGVCVVCDTTVAAHTGPVVSRAYRYRLQLIAEALVAVGRGVSCTRAAQRARVAALVAMRRDAAFIELIQLRPVKIGRSMKMVVTGAAE